MGFCGSLLRLSTYSLVALLAVLVYFHLECQRDSEEKERLARGRVFTPEQTDIIHCEMAFTRSGVDLELEIGMTYILVQSAPCALTKMIQALGGGAKIRPAGEDGPDPTVLHNVTISDARKTSVGDFHQTGFTLITLDKEAETTDWRTMKAQDENADIEKFHLQLEPYIRELYPQAKRLKWTYNVVRGGDKFGDQPPALGPHLDYHQNDTDRINFHQQFPVFPGSEADMLMGQDDDEEGKLGVLLGVWKPLTPAKICDFPLAIMDASTFDPEQLTKNELHINFGFFTFHNLNGAISYSPKQKWSYYSFQTPREVLVFHQYSKNRFLANPHTSFLNTNCPPGSAKRVSVEMRLGLYF